MVADRPVVPLPPGSPPADLGPLPHVGERDARRTLRRQVARLERELSSALVSAFPFSAPDVRVPGAAGPRLLDLGELESLRDALAARLSVVRAELHARGEREAEARRTLERMLAEPGRHRFLRVARADLGTHGCGYFEVRPRLGLVGMLAGWWHVKLSSGCPPSGRG